MGKKKTLGIYIHVPFCKSKCKYCDFYSMAGKTDKVMEAYLRAICDHIRETGPLAPHHRVDTIYFGGGTPSFFGAEGMAAIMGTIRKYFDVDSRAEITFEANPDSVGYFMLRRLKSEGFNRVSLGIQCDDDAILKAIGRPHTYKQAVKAVRKIRLAGFHNLSVDLMYGLPGQSLSGWEKTLNHVLELNPEHISCYGLKLEEGTVLHRDQAQYDLADDDTQADMYLSAVAILRRQGFRQYEISNFAKKDMESRHNLKYWMGEEYLGFGPDASSYFAGRRFAIVRDLKAYAEGIFRHGQVLRENEEILPRERAGEYLMLRLRTTQGISREEYERQFLMSFDPVEDVLRDYARKHLAVTNGKGHWRLTTEGFLLSNTIISDLWMAQENA